MDASNGPISAPGADPSLLPAHLPMACCAPGRTTTRVRVASPHGRNAETAGANDRMVLLPGGPFLMGTEDTDRVPGDGEGPVREVRLDPLLIDVAAVSNARFAAFVDDTGYVTEAERYGDSFVFDLFLPDGAAPTRAVAAAPWWRQVPGASWRTPEGPGSTIDDRLEHPVVHVTWNDAVAFATWAGARLPTEAEWEFAGRGGLEQRRFPWGDELEPGGEHRCNVWQGTFPTENTMADGYLGTAPVDAFAPNGFGLFNMSGNTWEWCSDRWAPRASERVMRGGSYLCHESYCNRYRVSARSRNRADSSSGNVGFRCARDA
jgi:sulfatase modifying factor 1